MFIETEGTPNPATLKFLPGRDVMAAATADFASADAMSPDQGYDADLAACRTLLCGGSRSVHAARTMSSWRMYSGTALSRIRSGSRQSPITPRPDSSWNARRARAGPPATRSDSWQPCCAGSVGVRRGLVVSCQAGVRAATASAGGPRRR